MRLISEPTSRVMLKRAQRRVREREKRHRRQGGQKSWPSARSRFTGETVRLAAPSRISLTDAPHRRGTLMFCRRIRQAYLQDARSVILDFSQTRKIEATGMLITVAEIDRCQRMGIATQRFLCKLPDEKCDETKIVRQVLDQIELLARTDHPKIHDDKSNFHSSVRNWRYATGTRADEEPGDVLEEHHGRIAPALMQRVQIGLMEAIINSLHHAYRAERNDGCKAFRERRWWMFTHEADGRLQVIVCDLGIGISRSLPLKWSKDLLKKLQAIFVGDHHDVASIQMALELGKTSTDEENRGKGLPQIWNALHEAEVGGVGIHSGHGHLSYTAETAREHKGYYTSPLLGTLIAWYVEIDEAAGKVDGESGD